MKDNWLLISPKDRIIVLIELDLNGTIALIIIRKKCSISKLIKSWLSILFYLYNSLIFHHETDTKSNTVLYDSITKIFTYAMHVLSFVRYLNQITSHQMVRSRIYPSRFARHYANAKYVTHPVWMALKNYSTFISVEKTQTITKHLKTNKIERIAILLLFKLYVSPMHHASFLLNNPRATCFLTVPATNSSKLFNIQIASNHSVLYDH